VVAVSSDVAKNANFFVTDNRVRYAKSYVTAYTGKVMKYTVVGDSGVVPSLVVTQLTGVSES
jgi:hypothetical protein